MSTPISPASPASSDSEDNRSVIVPITLAMIPTLRYLYKNQTLVQPLKQPRFPYREDFLDRISLFQGDITRLEVDAIVNAANRSLLGGGGVDGAIHDAAGPGLLKECRTLGGADTGEAKITKGYDLPAKHVIHAVGPIYSNSQRDIKAAQLSACYSNSLGIATENSLTSIAFCSISTGIYGYPIEDATHIALETTRDYLENKADAAKIERVVFVVWSNKDKDVYEQLIPQYFPEKDVETTAESQDPLDDAEAEEPPETQESQVQKEIELSSDDDADEAPFTAEQQSVPPPETKVDENSIESDSKKATE